jgi:acetoacetate decarboxylase
MTAPSVLSTLSLFRRFATPPSGALYRDATWLTARVALDVDRARAWLPAGVTLTTPATATVFVSHFPWTSFGSEYREAGVLFHVRRRLRRAVFCPWMVVDEDVALIAGRELLGYPKKLAERIELTIDGDEAHAICERRGTRLVEMHAKLGAEMDVDRAPPMLGQRVVNVRARRLVTFVPRERMVSARPATIELTIGSSPRDPLTDLGIATGRVLDAHLLRTDALLALPPRDLRAAGIGFSLRSWPLRGW